MSGWPTFLGRTAAACAVLCATVPAATAVQANNIEAGPVALVIERGSGSAIKVSKASDALGAPIELRSLTKPEGAISANAPPPSGLPVRNSGVTSRFGMRGHPILGGVRMHAGVDLAAPNGSPVVASADGVVSFANWNGGYGLLVAVRHGNGFETRFAHLSRILVRPGQQVSRGQVVGLVGSTGRSTGAHLHYEVRQNGRAIDPLR